TCVCEGGLRKILERARKVRGVAVAADAEQEEEVAGRMEKFTTWEDKSCGINPYVPVARKRVGVARGVLGVGLVAVRWMVLGIVAPLLAVAVGISDGVLVWVWPLHALARAVLVKPLVRAVLLLLGYGLGVEESIPDPRRLRLGRLSKQGQEESSVARGSFGATVRAGDVILFNHTNVVEVLYLYYRFGARFAFATLPDGAALSLAGGLWDAVARASHTDPDPKLAPLHAAPAAGLPSDVESLAAAALAKNAPLAIAAEGVRTNGKAVLEFVPAVTKDAFLNGSASRVHLVAFHYPGETWSPANTTSDRLGYLFWSCFQVSNPLSVSLVPHELRVARTQVRTESSGDGDGDGNGAGEGSSPSAKVDRMRSLLATAVGKRGVKTVQLGATQYFEFLQYFRDTAAPAGAGKKTSRQQGRARARGEDGVAVADDRRAHDAAQRCRVLRACQVRMGTNKKALASTATLSWHCGAGTGAAAAGEELRGPLHGVTVVEVGNFIAGPHAATILGYYGAQVYKIEAPGGDQLRVFRNVDETGTSWWWRSLGRNKKSIEIDLKKPGAQQVVRDLCAQADVLLENFRPGKMESWGLGPDDIEKVNKDIIYTRVSGYGQTGPYASRPGFASACEAMGGLRYVNGPAPVEGKQGRSIRPNLSLGDTLAGINAALGTVMALFAKQKGNDRAAGAHGKGGVQIVDAAIYEAVWGIMEGVLPDYDGANLVREPSGSTVSGIVPTNTYMTKDGKQIVIGANSNALFKRLMKAIGRSDLADSDQYDDNQKRVTHQDFLDKTIGDWAATKTAEEVMQDVQEAQVPNGLIYSITDIVTDPQYNSRGMIEEVDVPSLNRTLRIPGMSPKLSKTPGKTEWAGPELGQHSAEVFFDVLGYDQSKVDALVADGSIIWPQAKQV
ncbi:Succinyl-CoA--D-citramalate CoA-transferase, partial [Durusdinium trenchii]